MSRAQRLQCPSLWVEFHVSVIFLSFHNLVVVALILAPVCFFSSRNLLPADFHLC